LFSALALFPIKELLLLQLTALAVRPHLIVFVSPEEQLVGALSMASSESDVLLPTTDRQPPPVCPTKQHHSHRLGPGVPLICLVN